MSNYIRETEAIDYIKHVLDNFNLKILKIVQKS